MIAELDTSHSRTAWRAGRLIEDTSDGSHSAIRLWLDHGDQEAASWIVTHYRPFVRRIIKGWLPCPWIEDDVVQDVFARAFQALGRFDLRRSFRNWLAAIARNTCANAIRAHRRRDRVFASGDVMSDDLEWRAAEHERSVDAVFLAGERVEQIRGLVLGLKRQDGEILRLYCLEELPAELVAKRLGLSVGSVRVRAHRACHKLRSLALTAMATGNL